MKHLISFIFLTACVAGMLTSCNDDTESKATCTYYVQADSITYSDTTEAQYDTLIMQSLKNMSKAFYVFQKSATTDQGFVSSAILLCDESAHTQFKADLKEEITLSQLQNELFRSNSDFFTSKGFANAASIGLHPITVRMSLWNYTSSYIIAKENIIIE